MTLPVAARAEAQVPTSVFVLIGGLMVLGFAVATGTDVKVVAPIVLLAAALAIVRGRILRWQTMLACIVGVVFFIPIKRYTLPSGLPFNLEPYRVVIALVAAAWLSSLLIDPRVRLRRSGLEQPLILYAAAAVLSVIFAYDRIQAYNVSSEVVKSLTFFASFVVLFYLVVSLVRTRAHLENLLRVLVTSGTIVAFLGLIESRTHRNVFNYIGHALPMLHFNDPAISGGLTASYLDRSGQVRIYASAAHPIELSAVLVMLIPLAVYLMRSTGNKRWLLSVVLLGLAALATLSRTGVMMMVVCVLVFLWLRPVETRRLWPALVPAICVMAIALPHTVGTFYAAFFPKGGIVAEQTQAASAGAPNSNGRLARIGPGLSEWSRRPLFGEGFGSRVTAENNTDAPSGAKLSNILDNQWLGSLLETGIVGVLALVWLFTRSIRRMTRIARADVDDDGWLAVAFTASIISFAASMVTFDALGFAQVTILFFLLLALSSVFALLHAGYPDAAGQPRRRRSSRTTSGARHIPAGT